MHPWGPSFTQKCSRIFQENFLTAQLGTSAASWISNTPGLHPLCCAQAGGILESGFRATSGTVTTGCCATSLNSGRLARSTRRQTDRDEGTTRTTDAQLTEVAQGGYCSNLSLKRSYETSQIALSKPAIPNSFWKIMGTLHWVELTVVISHLILCPRPNQRSIQIKRFKINPSKKKKKKSTRSTKTFYLGL